MYINETCTRNVLERLNIGSAYKVAYPNPRLWLDDLLVFIFLAIQEIRCHVRSAYSTLNTTTLHFYFFIAFIINYCSWQVLFFTDRPSYFYYWTQTNKYLLVGNRNIKIIQHFVDFIKGSFLIPPNK